MRDKIAEIIRNARMNANPLAQVGYAEADALIANGVILPPCKVGDTMYVVNRYYFGTWKLFECKVEEITIFEKNIFVKFMSKRGNFVFAENTSSIGKTVFLTKEEAEKALKEKENG